FTLDPVTNDKTKIVIEAIYGLGELIVQGKVTPDHYEVSKKDFAILTKQTAEQIILLKKSGAQNKEKKVTKRLAKMQKISDKQIIELAKLGLKLEKHYYFPQDAEWAIEKNKIYIVQTRPVTTLRQSSGQAVKNQKEGYTLDAKRYMLLLKGDPASPGIASGPARIVKSAKEIGNIRIGEVLVAPQTNPDYVPAMKKAAAIVTERGGRTSHAAIVSRELGIGSCWR
ncbi:MAG: phosphoenolpyruvate synthase, partial [Candidatus Levybacteria bacterium]|nr:phosphoenolpyruvate synthase [Candidatus Levybacteria bacterium]